MGTAHGARALISVGSRLACHTLTGKRGQQVLALFSNFKKAALTKLKRLFDSDTYFRHLLIVVEITKKDYNMIAGFVFALLGVILSMGVIATICQ